MADTYRRDEASSYKRPSTETSSETIPSKKPSIGFNIKSSTSNKKPATTTKILKPGAMKKNLNPIALKLAKDKTKTEPTVVKKSSKVAAVFNEDSDESFSTRPMGKICNLMRMVIQVQNQAQKRWQLKI
ncbi:uncharacterized protein LOC144429864 [Styela clava]